MSEKEIDNIEKRVKELLKRKEEEYERAKELATQGEQGKRIGIYSIYYIDKTNLLKSEIKDLKIQLNDIKVKRRNIKFLSDKKEGGIE